MEIQLLPAVSLLPETIEASSSPRRRCWPGPSTATPTCSNSGSFLSPASARASSSTLDRSAIELIVRRAFTSVRAVDHPGGESPPLPDSGAQPQLYERARNIAGHLAQAMKQASRRGILLYALVLDRHLETIGPSLPTRSSASMICMCWGCMGLNGSQKP